MIQLTEAAAGALNSAIAAASSTIAGMRLTVQPGGCSGLKYQMGLVASAEPGDLSLQSHGVAIFVEPSCMSSISGTTIDFVESLEGAGFSFDNPQARSSCACGKSFC